MKSFESDFNLRLPLTHGLVRAVRTLGEFKGKEELFRRQMPQALETLRQVAIIQSTESSNRIEGVTASPERIRALIAEKTTPRNRSEQEISGYRDVLNTIHANYEAMPLSPGLILQLHRDLFKYSDRPGGAWKISQNRISEKLPDGTEAIRFDPVHPHLTMDYMNNLHERFTQFWTADDVDKLLLIPAYVLDFLCVHPFPDGNGRMARLISLLLLYQAGYGVGRFVSLERVIENSKDGYYDTLYQSSQHWHESEHSLIHWTEYFLGMLTAAYREFEQRVGLLTSSRGAKTEMVMDAISHFHGEFSVRDLQEQCPNVGIDLIRRLLKQEREAGRVEVSGRGPLAKWRRV